MTKQQLEQQVEYLKQQIKDVTTKYNYYYNANKQKKQENYSLRGENKTLKKQVIDLTVMVNYLREKK